MTGTTPFAPAPTDPKERAEYVAELRLRYLEGTLDEVLWPEGAELPDRLLAVLFDRRDRRRR